MAKHYIEVEFPVILTVLVETDDVDEILEKGEQLACNAIEKLAHISLTQNLIDYNLTIDTDNMESWIADSDFDNQ